MIFDFTVEITAFVHPMGATFNYKDDSNYLFWDIGSNTNTSYRVRNGVLSNESGHVSGNGGGGLVRVVYDTDTGSFQGYKNGALVQDRVIVPIPDGIGYGLHSGYEGRRFGSITAVGMASDDFARPNGVLDSPPWTYGGSGWFIINGEAGANTPGDAILGLSTAVPPVEPEPPPPGSSAFKRGRVNFDL